MSLFQNATYLASAHHLQDLPPPGEPEVAFAGRSNAGKSSAINALAKRTRLAFVSKTPGRTQQINFFLIDARLVFVDLPGYGFARVPPRVQQQWKHLVETYLSTRRNLRGVVIIVDLRRGVEADDAQLLDYLHAHGIPAILVATKADKLAYGARQRRTREVGEALAYPVAALTICSAESGEGMSELWTAITTTLEGTGLSREHR